MKTLKSLIKLFEKYNTKLLQTKLIEIKLKQ